MAVVGGAKVSSKIDAAGKSGGPGRDAGDRRRHGQHLPGRAKALASASRFYEPDYLETARKVIHMATESGCALLLPTDVVVAREFSAGAPHRTVPADQHRPPTKWRWMWAPRPSPPSKIAWPPPKPWSGTALLAPLKPRLSTPARWRRPGRWPQATKAGQLLSVAGGGDTVAALAHAGVENDFTLCLDRRRGIPGMA